MKQPHDYIDMGRLRTLIWREFVELSRDPFTILIMTVFPLLMIAMLSYALTTEVRNLPLGVFDADKSELSRRLVGSLESTGYFKITRLSSLSGLKTEMASSGLSAALLIPANFSSDLARGRTTRLQALFDGTETVIAANAEGIIDATVATFQERLRRGDPRSVSIAGGIAPPVGLAPGETDPEGGNVQAVPRGRDPADTVGSGQNLSRARGVGSIRVVQRNLFNPGMKPTDFTIPGLIGFISTFLCIVTMALAIVREREAGTFEQLRVTPVTSIEIIAGKVLPMAFVYLIDVGLLMGIGYFLFDIWPRGSVFLLFVVTSLYLLMNLCWGLIISTAAPSAEQAVQTSVLVVVPQLSLSGLIFPIHSMPEWARAVVELIPLAHYLRIIRGIYLSGSGLSVIWFECLILAAFFTFFMVLLTRSVEKMKV